MIQAVQRARLGQRLGPPFSASARSLTEGERLHLLVSRCSISGPVVADDRAQKTPARVVVAPPPAECVTGRRKRLRNAFGQGGRVRRDRDDWGPHCFAAAAGRL